jgi:Na+/melibiose symporter-like transporter
MNSLLAGFWKAGSVIAGLLIGLSMVVPVFAMTGADPGTWQQIWVFGALVILALGLALQVVVTTKPRHRRTTRPALEPCLSESSS